MPNFRDNKKSYNYILDYRTIKNVWKSYKMVVSSSPIEHTSTLITSPRWAKTFGPGVPVAIISNFSNVIKEDIYDINSDTTVNIVDVILLIDVILYGNR